VRALVIGNNTIDRVYFLPGALCVGTKTSSVDVRELAGGQAANVAVALARLGIAVDYRGAFGADHDGDRVRAAIAAAGVDVARCPRRASCRQHAAAVLVDATGERTILMSKDPGLRLAATSIAPDDIAAVDAVYLDGHEPDAGLRAATLARDAGIPVVLDGEIADDGVRAMLPLVDTFIAQVDVLAALTGETEVESALAAALALGPRLVVVTRGAGGALALARGGALLRIPAQPCRPRDTTGAGDAFRAGYVAATLGGLDLAAALAFAARCGAAQCEVLGPQLTAAAAAALRWSA
jgi:sugar/nucleoside kinase (ribokinase family)